MGIRAYRGRGQAQVFFEHMFFKGIEIAEENAQEIKSDDTWEMMDNTVKYWREFLTGARQINTGIPEIDRLYKGRCWYLPL